MSDFRDLVLREIELRPIMFKRTEFTNLNPNFSSEDGVLNAPIGTLYIQDDDTIWVKISGGVWTELSSFSGTPEFSIEYFPFTFSNSGIYIITNVQANQLITQVNVTINSAFDGDFLISVGTTENFGLFMLNSENLPNEIGSYIVNPNYQFSQVTNVVINISNTTATQGSGIVSISLKGI